MRIQNFNGTKMESLFIPTEKDFQRWITNAVKETLGEVLHIPAPDKEADEPFLTREEMIAILKISMNTLSNWQKDGLPFHKVQNRVYFLKSEVFLHIKSHKMGTLKDGQAFSEIGK